MMELNFQQVPVAPKTTEPLKILALNRKESQFSLMHVCVNISGDNDKSTCLGVKGFADGVP